jgi:hypothetical protein
MVKMKETLEGPMILVQPLPKVLHMQAIRSKQPRYIYICYRWHTVGATTERAHWEQVGVTAGTRRGKGVNFSVTRVLTNNP